jgi:glycosyltransferase involved in cell wall biosynthesis
VQELKISLITVAYNADKTIERCIRSVIAQSYPNIEYIVIDGGSTDKTLEILSGFKANINQLVSEPDRGVYDAMNKGIKIATGTIVGMLNADDVLANIDVLAHVAHAFRQHSTGIVYGDLDYVSAGGRIIRKWRSGEYRLEAFNRGWMPPHPTFYCKTDLYYKYGFYSLEYGTAADYELMLRLMFKNHVSAVYLPEVMVKMQIGGKSNQSVSNRVKASSNDRRAMKENGIKLPWLTALLKPLSKIKQYF